MDPEQLATTSAQRRTKWLSVRSLACFVLPSFLAMRDLGVGTAKLGILAGLILRASVAPVILPGKLLHQLVASSRYPLSSEIWRVCP